MPLKKSKAWELVPCDREGRIQQDGLTIPPGFTQNGEATAALYAKIGFVPPWIGYATIDGDVVVGGGAFVGAPQGGTVEIAYFTLEPHEGRGYAGFTARELVAIARKAYTSVSVIAKTLPEQNPSTRILTRLGFKRVGTVEDEDAGEVWLWRL